MGTALKLVIGRLKTDGRSTHGQSVIVPRSPGLTLAKAKTRVLRAGFHPSKSHTTKTSYRFRLSSPKLFKPRSFRTIVLGNLIDK